MLLHRDGMKFVVSPAPVYSTGCAGASAVFAAKMEAFLLQHRDSHILGVLTGGDHVFSAFRQENTQIIVGGSGGGELDQINSLECVASAERVWNGSELHGGLSESEDTRTAGYRNHLDSYAVHTRTEVYVTDADVRFVVRDLDSLRILQNYSYEISAARNWGPIVSPYEGGANVTWWTRDAQKTMACVDGVLYYGTDRLSKTRTHTDCSFDPAVKKTKFHQLFINSTKFSTVIEDRRVEYDNSPREAHRFVLTSDAHEEGYYIAKSVQDMDEFDFHACAGDTLYWKLSIEYQVCFLHWHQRPFIQGAGNHEIYTNLTQIEERPLVFYQNVQGVNFYVLNVFNNTGYVVIDEAQIEESFAFLEREIDLQEGPKIIISHQPVYSTGTFGSTPALTTRMEQFLDAHPHSQILAVVSGHDHLFSAFRRNNVYFLDVATNGGLRSDVNNETMGERGWAHVQGNDHELHGPLNGADNENSLGYEYHLDSYREFTRTEVEITETGHVTYTVRGLRDWAVLAVYEQDVSGE